MDAQHRLTRIILGLVQTGCACGRAAGIACACACAGVAAAAAAPHREHVDFRALSFAYGDLDAARDDLKRIYPEGLVQASDVVADLKRAGATCAPAASAASCSYDDSVLRDEYPQRVTWRFRVNSRPDGALATLDLTQTLRR